MFENVEPLDRSRHGNLRLAPARGYAFARGLTTVPLSYGELSRASKFYPIVFPAGDQVVPHVLLSLKQGENTFVGQDGEWIVPYVPAHIRRYPFILARTDEEGNYAVCVDPRAPHLSSDEGQPLYTEEGEPSDVLSRAMEFLKRYQREMSDTEWLFTNLQGRGLLSEKVLTVGRGEQQQAAIRGFRAVDTDRLAEMEDSVLVDWVRRGIMGLVYAHLHSLDNVRELARRQNLESESE